MEAGAEPGVGRASEGGAGAGPGEGEAELGLRVLRIVVDVLGDRDSGLPLDQVQHSHFQDLGGSSLQAIRICARVRKESGVTVAPEELFDADTVGDFCSALARTAHQSRTAHQTHTAPQARSTPHA
ncbi:acyl carrier protein [Streptomyces sp. Da 82-17]|uniref:acyl carrier protein n=1 Tax=Streptomyces sp. Da 82-17 TaxID=3377116 RepID=UPI0038D3BCD8